MKNRMISHVYHVFLLWSNSNSKLGMSLQKICDINKTVK